MWLPVHDDEWDGDVPVDNAHVTPRSTEAQTGTVVFQGSTLPWTVGRYEVCILVGLPCLVIYLFLA